MKNFFNKVFLCFSVLLLSGAVYAQSDGVKQILVENNDKDSDKDGLPKRDFGIETLLPIVLYDGLNENLAIVSPQVTFESVAYYIVDEFGFVQQQGEMTLRKGDEVEISLSSLSPGMYGIVLEIGGECFQGEFEVE